MEKGPWKPATGCAPGGSCCCQGRCWAASRAARSASEAPLATSERRNCWYLLHQGGRTVARQGRHSKALNAVADEGMWRLVDGEGLSVPESGLAARRCFPKVVPHAAGLDGGSWCRRHGRWLLAALLLGLLCRHGRGPVSPAAGDSFAFVGSARFGAMLAAGGQAVRHLGGSGTGGAGMGMGGGAGGCAGGVGAGGAWAVSAGGGAGAGSRRGDCTGGLPAALPDLLRTECRERVRSALGHAAVRPYYSPREWKTGLTTACAWRAGEGVR